MTVRNRKSWRCQWAAATNWTSAWKSHNRDSGAGMNPGEMNKSLPKLAPRQQQSEKSEREEEESEYFSGSGWVEWISQSHFSFPRHCSAQQLRVRASFIAPGHKVELIRDNCTMNYDTVSVITSVEWRSLQSVCSHKTHQLLNPKMQVVTCTLAVLRNNDASWVYERGLSKQNVELKLIVTHCVVVCNDDFFFYKSRTSLIHFRQKVKIKSLQHWLKWLFIQQRSSKIMWVEYFLYFLPSGSLLLLHDGSWNDVIGERDEMVHLLS